jgi:hypothetical protein
MEALLNHLPHLFITTHAYATLKLHEVWTLGRMERNVAGKVNKYMLCTIGTYFQDSPYCINHIKYRNK